MIERLDIEGDAHVRDAATVGLVEGIQNNSEYAGIEHDAYIEFLRPDSLMWWNKLNDYWTSKGQIGEE